MHKTQNIFWQNVFKYWILLCRSQTVESNSEIMLSNILYNFHISHQPLYLPKWHKNGIHLIGDIVKTNGELFTFQEIKSIHNLNDNVFNYNRVRLCVHKFLKNMKKLEFLLFQDHPYHYISRHWLQLNKVVKASIKFLSENLALTAFPTVSQNGENYSEIITLTPFGITCIKHVLRLPQILQSYGSSIKFCITF